VKFVSRELLKYLGIFCFRIIHQHCLETKEVSWFRDGIWC